MERPAWRGHPDIHHPGKQPPNPIVTAMATTSPLHTACHRCHRSLVTLTLWGQCPSLLPPSVGGSALQIHHWQKPRPELLPHLIVFVKKRDLFSLSPNYQELRTSPHHLSAVTSLQRSCCRHWEPVLAIAPTPGVIMVLPYGSSQIKTTLGGFIINPGAEELAAPTQAPSRVSRY